jgi:hypothetical protein
MPLPGIQRTLGLCRLSPLAQQMDTYQSGRGQQVDRPCQVFAQRERLIHHLLSGAEVIPLVE